jgi:D-arabinose 1-dehydrogenase-like Zn-dependent alcohol dehydrogenase
MKAAVVTSPGKISVAEVPDPIIEEYDVLCETLACAVCCGTDNHIVANHPYFKAEYPLILGHEGVGRVISRGGKVRSFDVGDVITRVVNRLPGDSGYALHHGAFASLSIATDWRAMREDGLPIDSWRPHTIHHSLPSHLDPVAATMIITWRETYAFFARMKPQQSDSLLILGSGATALAYADHAKNLGIKAVIVGNPERERQFKRAGAYDLISYAAPEIEMELDQSDISPFDIIIDTVGQSDMLNRALGLLKPDGRIGIYGLDSTHDYQIDYFRTSGDFSCFNGEHYDEGSAHDDIMAFVESGFLNAWDYISKKYIYSLDHIQNALNACKNRKTFKSVVVF